MANIELFAPFVFKWEGGFANDPNDKGGPTFRGVTLATWKQIGYDKDPDGEITSSDLRLLNKQEIVNKVLKPLYWDQWHADQMISQSTANLLVDWVWCSGKWGIILPQRVMHLLPDGIVGDKTLQAVNSADPQELFLELQQRRKEYLENICRSRRANSKFLQGWLNRLYDLKFSDL